MSQADSIFLMDLEQLKNGQHFSITEGEVALEFYKESISKFFLASQKLTAASVYHLPKRTKEHILSVSKSYAYGKESASLRVEQCKLVLSKEDPVVLLSQLLKIETKIDTLKTIETIGVPKN